MPLLSRCMSGWWTFDLPKTLPASGLTPQTDGLLSSSLPEPGMAQQSPPCAIAAVELTASSTATAASTERILMGVILDLKVQCARNALARGRLARLAMTQGDLNKTKVAAHRFVIASTSAVSSPVSAQPAARLGLCPLGRARPRGAEA